MNPSYSVLIYKVLNRLQRISLIEGDLICDEIRRYYFAVHIAGFDADEAREMLMLSPQSTDIIDMLAKYNIGDIGPVIEGARRTMWISTYKPDSHENESVIQERLEANQNMHVEKIFPEKQ